MDVLVDFGKDKKPLPVVEVEANLDLNWGKWISVSSVCVYTRSHS